MSKYVLTNFPQVCNSANYGAGQLIIHLQSTGEDQESLAKLIGALARNCAHHSSNDVRSFASNMVHMINISGVEPLADEYVKQLMLPLIDNTTKKIPLIRGASEVAIATLLRLKTTEDIATRLTPSLDPKSLEIFNRFLPTAKRVSQDFRTYSNFENNIFSFLPNVH